MVSRADGADDGACGFVALDGGGESLPASSRGEAEGEGGDCAVCDALGEVEDAFDWAVLDRAGLDCEESDGELLCGEFDA